ncbi:MAG TPA: autotransporter domain-containing protein, partial [Xanthobacteraceae bacterium]
GANVSGGALALTGSGTVSGAAGVTTAAGATFDISATTAGASITTLAGSGGTVNLGARTLTLSNASSTFAGAINGTGGGLTLTAGTETLTGTNVYTGATTVNGGTLQAGAANAFSPFSAFTVASGATLNLAGFNQAIGSLAGAGGVTLGSATLTTGGDNTSTTFSGAIGGTGGALVKLGSGTFTLSGANTYTGGTTITAGTLQLGSGGAGGSIVGNVVDNATFAINRSDTYTFGGAISGTGAFMQIGSGTTVLTATNLYTGATTINAGTLVVNGSIATSSLTTVNNGGTLKGTGTVGNARINSGGTLAPGNSPGTITVAGNLAFQSGALYLVQVTPSTASSANVSGTASLAGTVQTVFAPGTYVGRSYDILHSAGLNGTTFSGVSGNVPTGLTESLSYTSTDVLLTLTATLGQSGGLAGNQGNVSNAINNFFNNGGALPPGFLSLFGLSGNNLANALSLTSGEAATGAQQGAFQLMDEFLGLMLDPFVDGRSSFGGGGPAFGFAPEREELPDDIALAYAKALKAPPKPPGFDQRWTAWGAAFGGVNKTDGDPLAGSHDLTARAGGVAAGLDYHVTRDTVVGAALAGAGTDWSLAQGLGGGKSDAFQAGVYGATRAGPAYLAAALAFANYWMSTDRFAAFGDHLTASFNAQSFGGRVEGGYRLAMPAGGVSPYAAVQAQSFHTPAYSETDVTGGGFGLAFNARSASDTRSELGARFDHAVALDPSKLLTLRGRLAWAHDWVSDPTLAPVFQALPGASFIVNGATPPKDSALASAGAELRLPRGVTLLGKFDGEFANHAATYAGTGTLRYAW